MDNIKLDSDKIALIINFFNLCNIKCSSLDSLDDITIDRSTLLLPELYEKVKPQISSLKIILKSTSNTSVQKTAQNNQRWPLINLIRQLLKHLGYDLYPKRIANGYAKDGTKLYKRLFIIKKNNGNNGINLNNDLNPPTEVKNVDCDI